MAAIESLHTHLVDELLDLLDAEQQLTKALPKMARAATARPLRTAFEKHLKETRGHISRLNQAIRDLGEKPKSKTCEGMQGLLEEGETVMNKTPEGALRDAVMITGAQKVEHYEMASYGTARTYAQVLGQTGVARLLDQTLKEEKAADMTLTRIAEGSVNEEAAEEWQSQEDEESTMSRSAGWASSAARSATRQFSSGVRRVASAVGFAQDRSSGGGRRGSGRKSTNSSRRRRTAGKKR
jgi:ferritin-like metal-binding protein YciE